MPRGLETICNEVLGELPALQETFMSFIQLNDAITAGTLAPRPSIAEDDRCYEKANPEHPLAASKRLTRIAAADRIMKLAREYGRTLPREILEVLHRCLFDCSAAVRQSLAGALFFSGDDSSLEVLSRLLELEKDSPAVRLRARAALERLATPFILPKQAPQVVIVLDQIMLVEELMQLAGREGFSLRHARPGTPDVIAFGAHVKIIDPLILGNQAWDDFCDYLAEVNTPGGECPDNAGEATAEGALTPDDTPLIIIQDHPGQRLTNRTPAAIGPVHYVPAWNEDLVCQKVLEYTQMPQAIVNVAAVR